MTNAIRSTDSSPRVSHKKGSCSSPVADDATLCRRLHLDLIGLPPSPADLQQFARDGYEATVDRLLASPRFGEKWARHWLDVARYSDTNGYEKDLRRDQWAWRDWVISALNADLPYDQFVIEQIAGDLLPAATQDNVIATGFLRNSMLNEEGAIVPEQFRMFEMFDRMDCLGKAILGLTTQCAQCHTHKYDPLTHDEYYGMLAFINNTYEARSAVYTEPQLQAIADLRGRIEELEENLRRATPDWESAVGGFAAELREAQPSWTPLIATELGSVSGLNHPTQLADHSLLMLGHTSSEVYLIAEPVVAGATGMRIEVLTHGDLPLRGPGRSPEGSWELKEVEVFVQHAAGGEWEPITVANASADFAEAKRTSGKNNEESSGPVAHLIDGSQATTWKADRGRVLRNQPSVAAIQFAEPLDLSRDTRLKVALHMKAMIGCCRLSLTCDADPEVPPVAHAAVLASDVPAETRSPSEQAALFTAWRQSRTDFEATNDAIAALWQQFPEPTTSVLHLAKRESRGTRVTHRLDRGEWDRPLQAVVPHTPAFLHPLLEDAAPGRLAFARWLVNPASPLAARVAVNRIWLTLFGEGLVETPEDFGTRAPLPTFPGLLDWLAVDFMQRGWSQKQLIKTIVLSRTYRQTSQVSPDLLRLDPRNQLLARGPRFRCDAEVVRDIALSASGLITHELGGPPVIPPVPQNVLDINFVYPAYWKAAEGPERYRRTLYGFRKRSMPDPVMASFDGPNGDLSCPRRIRSNTPLAALTALNEPIFFEAAQAMAIRVLTEAQPDDASRASYAFQLCTAREPSVDEHREILELLASRRQRLADGWLNPREIATGDADRLPELPPATTPQDAAAWTVVCRVLLNLDETISKN